MAIAKLNHRLTAAEYLEIERHAETKSEFFDGEMFAMAGGTKRHSLIAVNLGAEIRRRLRGPACVAFNADLRVKVNASGLYTYPDLSAVCGAQHFEDEQEDTLLNPNLIVEILSESTQHYDRGAKFALYRQLPSLREYLLVSQWEARIEQYYLGADSVWRFRDIVGLQSQLDLDSVSITIPLAEIYENVELPLVPPPAPRFLKA